MLLCKKLFLLFLAFSVFLIGCASSSVIVTGTVRDEINSEYVKLYLEAPQKYEVIGLINASSGMGFTEQQDVDYAIAELKKQAAKLGANGVIITTTDEKTHISSSGDYLYTSTSKTITGKAIFVY